MHDHSLSLLLIVVRRASVFASKARNVVAGYRSERCDSSLCCYAGTHGEEQYMKALKNIWNNREQYLQFVLEDTELSKQEYLSLAKWCFWIGVPAHILFALHFAFNMNLQEDWLWRLGIVAGYIGFYVGAHNKFYRTKLIHLHRYLWLGFSVLQLIYLPMHMYHINNYDIMWLTSFPFFALMLLATIKSFDLFWAGLFGLLSTLVTMHFGSSARMDIVMSLYLAPLCVGGYAMIYIRNMQRQVLNKANLIEESYNKLKEYEHKKDDFIASVAHEIRTPLSIAVSGVEEMLSRLPCQSCDKDLIKYCHMVTAALQSIQSQVNDLIEAEKLARVNIILSKQNIELDSWLPTVSEKLNALCRTKSLEYSCVLEQQGITAIFDPARIETVLTNLVSNSVKFTPSRGRVSVTVGSTANNELSIVVQDTGCGISSEDIPFIFDKYYQANSTTCLGIGLGLSLVRTIVSAHDGRISVTSSRNRGTKMSIVLGRTSVPVFSTGEVTVQEDTESLQDSIHMHQGQLLFVIEDNHVMMDLISNHLARKKYSVLGFSDPLKALESIELYHPAVVLSDLNLPGMSGIEMMHKIRSVYSDLPFIFVTAHAQAHDLVATYQNVRVLEKPFVFCDLEDLVREALNTYKP
jgi:signal transduction histidine kinase